MLKAVTLLLRPYKTIRFSAAYADILMQFQNSVTTACLF
eukprot:jgi/Antlo1/2164/1750